MRHESRSPLREGSVSPGSIKADAAVSSVISSAFKGRHLNALKGIHASNYPVISDNDSLIANSLSLSNAQASSVQRNVEILQGRGTFS